MKALILVRGEQKENSFGRYTAEILRAEGLNWYQVEELGSQNAAYLSGFELVVLTRCFVGRAEIERLLDYVRGGGRLICFRPCLRLAQALGLEPTYAAQKGGTLRLNGAHGVGQGLGERSIQVHGMAEHWKVPAGSPLVVGAWLAEEPSGLPEHPALLLGPCGDGQVAIFTYDLAGTVAAIRQGDPARANSLSLGLSGLYKPNELFVGHTDAVCAQIPQADVHSALLADVIEALARHPMPRLWYYARPDQRSVIVLTSDDDWSAVTDFEAFMAAAEAHGGHATFFLVPDSAITRELAEEWARRGHAFGVHPDYRALSKEAQGMGAQGIDEQYWTLKEMLRASVRGFEERFGVPARTTRHHALRWVGYVEAARTLHDLGVQMEFNYYSMGPLSALYMTGSGRPMKFVAEDGEIIQVFQQSTILAEEALVGSANHSLRLTTQQALERATCIVDENLERYYTAIGFNTHPVSFTQYARPFMEGFLAIARQRKIPILTAEEWLDFTLARYSAEFEGVEWEDSTLRFGLRRGEEAAQELTVMVPLGERTVRQVAVDGCPHGWEEEQRWGRRFALLHLAEPGRAHAVQMDFAKV